MEKEYEGKYLQIKDKIRNDRKIIRNTFIYLFLFVTSVFFLSNYELISTLIFISSLITLLIILSFTILTFLAFITTLSKMGKNKIKLNEYLFAYIFELYNALDKYNKNRTDVKEQEKAQIILDKIEGLLSRSAFIDTGFGTSETEVSAMNIFYDSVEKYKKAIESPSPDELNSYLNFFNNLLKDAYEGDINSFNTHVSTNYKKTENKILSGIRSVIKFRTLSKYVISVITTTILTSIVIYALEIPILTDAGSFLSGAVAYCVLAGGIKKYVLDKLDDRIYGEK